MLIFRKHILVRVEISTVWQLDISVEAFISQCSKVAMQLRTGSRLVTSPFQHVDMEVPELLRWLACPLCNQRPLSAACGTSQSISCPFAFDVAMGCVQCELGLTKVWEFVQTLKLKLYCSFLENSQPLALPSFLDILDSLGNVICSFSGLHFFSLFISVLQCPTPQRILS